MSRVLSGRGSAEVAAALALCGVISGNALTSTTAGAQVRGDLKSSQAIALLLDGRVVSFTPSSGAIKAEMSFGRRRFEFAGGRFLARSQNGLTLYALLPPTVKDRTQAVAVIGLDKSGTMRLRRRIALPSGVVFHVLLIGRKTGRIYLVGNRPLTDNTGPQPEDAVAAAIDRGSHVASSVELLRASEGRDWQVFDASITASEEYLYVSYHGNCLPSRPELCTTGADWFATGRGGFRQCPDDSDPQAGCLSRVHGRVEPYRGSVLATTGDGPLITVDRAARRVRTWPTGIPGNHLLQFAVAERRAFVVGSCAYRGGLGVIPLRGENGAQSRPRHRRDRGLCGERIKPDGPRLLVAKNAAPVPDLRRAAVLVVDVRTLHIIRAVRMPYELLDFLVAARSEWASP